MPRKLVALVGRPNVGKSTLFNRLAGRRLALVEDVPGVTRDRHYAESEWLGRPYTLIDTGGFLPDETDSLLQAVREQAQLAIEEADVIVFVVDGRAGLTAADEAIAAYLRRTKKPVIVAVNKIDSSKMEGTSLFPEFFRLGFEQTLPVSAEHGRGVDDLMDKVIVHLGGPVPVLEEEEAEETPEAKATREEAHRARPARLAIIGRPNVGKSTLVNALLGTKRHVASPVPGTTTDPIDSELTFKGRRIILTDTAGIRRKKAIAAKLEHYSVVAALKTVEASDVVVLLIDALEPAVDQDERLAGIAEEKGRGLVIVVNKWDLVEKKPGDEEEGRRWVKSRFRFASYAPVIFTSALKGERVNKVLEAALDLYDQFTFRAPTPQLNKLLEGVQEAHPAPVANGRRIRMYYMAQVSSRPPTFVMTCSQPEHLPDSYKRYLENELRKAFGLKVPIRLLFRERPGAQKRKARINKDKLQKKLKAQRRQRLQSK
ncbi:MAG: ribosome biogenesis GTPase Der [Myxococcaceae bacterium]|nr:ribosome biogenesis GTPase Der [Myxococcaceae bacterium]